MKRTRLRLRAWTKGQYMTRASLCWGGRCLNVPSQCLGQLVRFALDLKDFDRLVRRACREAAAIVVEHCVMLSTC